MTVVYSESRFDVNLHQVALGTHARSIHHVQTLSVTIPYIVLMCHSSNLFTVDYFGAKVLANCLCVLVLFSFLFSWLTHPQKSRVNVGASQASKPQLPGCLGHTQLL
jgi:hypothetical protein